MVAVYRKPPEASIVRPELLRKGFSTLSERDQMQAMRQMLSDGAATRRFARGISQSPHWLPWSRQERSAPIKFATRVLSLAMPAELLDELLGMNRQEPLRLPCDPQPAADRCTALQQWNAANVTSRNDDGGRDDRDPIASTRQSDSRVWSAALKEHARPNTRNPAGGLEPVARSKFVAEKEKWFVGEFGDLDRAAAAELVIARNHCEAAHRIEQPNAETIVIDRHEGEVHIAELKAARHRDTSFLDQLNLDAGISAPVPAEEMRKRIFNDLRCGRDAENAGLPLLERGNPLVEGFYFSQQAAAEPKQAFALRGEFEAPAYPIK